MVSLAIGIDPSGARSGAKVVQRNLRLVKSDANSAERAMNKLGRNSSAAMRNASRSTGVFSAAVGKAKIAVVALGAAVIAATVAGFKSANGLDAALAEASTLLEGTTKEMALMRKEAIAMASQFGGSTTQQVQAFYQAISAGAGTVENASKLLQTANRLAKGGVTDITTAVDILTTATNAYSESSLTAASASDTLFAGVKAGKTTVTELGSSLGKVLPIAEKMGISFEEVVAAVSTLTLKGLSTSEAVTGLKGALSNLIKPSEKAKNAAELMNLEFNASSLQTKSLAGFLAELADKTGGSAEVMGQLFESTEGMAAVLSLTSGEASKFIEINAAMNSSLGSTQAAADKVSKSYSDRLSVSLGKVKLAAEFLGNLLLKVVVPALENLIAAGEFIVSIFTAIPSIFNAAANALGIYSTAADASGNASFNAEIATKQLAEQLGVFSDTAAPNAGAAAIALASDNNKLAASALAAAKAELAKVEALQTAFAANPNRPRSLVTLKGESIDDINARAFETKITAALEKIKLAEEDVLNTTMAIAQVTQTVADKFEEADTKAKGMEITIDKVGASASKAKPEIESLTDASEELSNSMSDSFGRGVTDIIRGTQTIGGAFKNMASIIIEELFKILVVEKAIASLKSIAGNIFGGGINIGGGGTGSLGLPLPFAKGAAFDSGQVTPFANGGVVNGPTIFPMANGAGLMGEAGPEAVMPLTRGRDGKLGVKSSGGGGVTQNVTINAVGEGDLDRILARRMPQLKEMVISVMRNERGRGAFA